MEVFFQYMAGEFFENVKSFYRFTGHSCDTCGAPPRKTNCNRLLDSIPEKK
jgi:hypothetical protein